MTKSEDPVERLGDADQMIELLGRGGALKRRGAGTVPRDGLIHGAAVPNRDAPADTENPVEFRPTSTVALCFAKRQHITQD